MTSVKQTRIPPVFTNFIDGIVDYVAAHRPEEIVRDFIAGMTDQYFCGGPKQCGGIINL
ncbi:MAG: hypothetical protein R2875_18735 [Desulfobacterales bacterium]